MTDARELASAQYESWVYPLPIPDLAEAIGEGVHDVGDPSLFRRKLWPRKVEAGRDASDHIEKARRFFQQMAGWDHFQFEIP